MNYNNNLYYYNLPIRKSTSPIKSRCLSSNRQVSPVRNQLPVSVSNNHQVSNNKMHIHNNYNNYNKSNSNDLNDFKNKINSIYKFSNINLNNPNNQTPIIDKVIKINPNNNISTNNFNDDIHNNNLNNYENDANIQEYIPDINFDDDNSNNNSNNINNNINSNNSDTNIINNNNIKQIVLNKAVFGIKKTILTDNNLLSYTPSNNDFKIGINRNTLRHKTIFDCFYLFPNIVEINTTKEINVINEKRVEQFINVYDKRDIQYFPIDYVACGINIPMKTLTYKYKKLIIKNIYWNIFQSISNEHYKNNEILCMVPKRNEYIYKKIDLNINIELHSQIFTKNNQILPYKDINNNNIQTPANTCIYRSIPLEINVLNGCIFKDIEINLSENIDISCALLCLKISVPTMYNETLIGVDKNNQLYHGNIPFSQFIVNLDYELE